MGNAADRAHFLMWLAYSETCLGFLGAGSIKQIDAARERFGKQFAYIEKALSDNREFLVGGSFSGADIMIGVSMFFAESMDFLTEEAGLPHCRAYWGRLQQRPAYRAALEAVPEPEPAEAEAARL